MSSEFTITTPITPPFIDSISSEVYEPAEDSFLLLDALEQDLPFQISQSQEFQPTLCLEVGPGSGIISTGLSSTQYFSNAIPVIFAMDINPTACNFTLQTATANQCSGRIECIVANGLDLRNGLSRWKFDLILCNPPYVPTPVEEQLDHPVNAAWDGGPDGNSKFILPFLQLLPELLSDSGRAYLLLSIWNKPEELMKSLVPKLGMEATLVMERRAGREFLSVWRLQK